MATRFDDRLTPVVNAGSPSFIKDYEDSLVPIRYLTLHIQILHLLFACNRDIGVFFWFLKGICNASSSVLLSLDFRSSCCVCLCPAFSLGLVSQSLSRIGSFNFVVVVF